MLHSACTFNIFPPLICFPISPRRLTHGVWCNSCLCFKFACVDAALLCIIPFIDSQPVGQSTSESVTNRSLFNCPLHVMCHGVKFLSDAWSAIFTTLFTIQMACEGQTFNIHDGVIKSKHFPRYWPFVSGIHRSPVDSPQNGQWRGALMFSLICFWTNGWANNRDSGDLRRHRTHYDFTVMNDVYTCMLWVMLHLLVSSEWYMYVCTSSVNIWLNLARFEMIYAKSFELHSKLAPHINVIFIGFWWFWEKISTSSRSVQHHPVQCEKVCVEGRWLSLTRRRQFVRSLNLPVCNTFYPRWYQTHSYGYGELIVWTT